MTREDMIAALEAADTGAHTAPTASAEPSREDMIAALQAGDQGPSTLDRVKQGLGYALKPLDYLGGLARTGIAGHIELGANALQGLKSLATGEDAAPLGMVSSGDFVNAMKGSAPRSSEFMQRAGVPAGPSLSDAIPAFYSKDPGSLRPSPGGRFDPNVRDAAGFASDIATDPLTYIPGAAAGKAGLRSILNPAERGLQAGGKAVYQSAPIMKAADAINERFGKGAASDILFDQGVRGTGRQIAEKGAAIADKTITERNALLGGATDKGAVLDMNQAMTPAQDFVNKIKNSRDPQMLPIANALEDQIAQYRGLNAAEASSSSKRVPTGILDPFGNRVMREETKAIPAVRGVTPLEGSQFKTNLYNALPNSTWDSVSRTPQGALGRQKLAQGLDAETSRAAGAVTPGAAEGINELNDTAGALLTPKKIMESEAVKGEKQNAFTSVDGILLGLGHAHPLVLATKKAADLGKTNWLRTNLGYGASQLGKAVPYVGGDQILRRGVIDDTSDWTKIMKKGNGP